jgi:GPI mannosyltransferase 3
VYYGVSATFGVEPWTYYLLGEIGVWGGACATVLLLALLGARRMPLLLVLALVILTLHSVIAHKEYRFIYPAVSLVTVLAGIGLAQMMGWGRDWLIGRGMSENLAARAGAALALAWWGAASFQVWNGATLTALRRNMHDNLSAASFVAHRQAPCGIGLYGLGGIDWKDYGGYTYFHRPAPMYWPEDEDALIAAAGFDTLLYTQRPPPSLGFATLRCMGEVCVAHRPGGCRSIPVTPLPIPAALIESAAAKATRSLASDRRNVMDDRLMEGQIGAARAIAGKAELFRPHEHE